MVISLYVIKRPWQSTTRVVMSRTILTTCDKELCVRPSPKTRFEHKKFTKTSITDFQWQQVIFYAKTYTKLAGEQILGSPIKKSYMCHTARKFNFTWIINCSRLDWLHLAFVYLRNDLAESNFHLFFTKLLLTMNNSIFRRHLLLSWIFSS